MHSVVDVQLYPDHFWWWLARLLSLLAQHVLLICVVRVEILVLLEIPEFVQVASLSTEPQRPNVLSLRLLGADRVRGRNTDLGEDPGKKGQRGKREKVGVAKRDREK